jgi:hypothetical protein
VSLFLMFFTKIIYIYIFLITPCVVHDLPISSYFIWSLQQYMMKFTCHDAPHCATFFNLSPTFLAFIVRSCQPISQHLRWRITIYRLIIQHIHTTLRNFKASHPTTTWGSAIPW